MSNIASACRFFCGKCQRVVFQFPQHTQIIPEAKRIVDEHPDSAYVLLKKVDFNGLTDNESKALYALIHSKTNMYMGHYFQI